MRSGYWNARDLAQFGVLFSLLFLLLTAGLLGESLCSAASIEATADWVRTPCILSSIGPTDDVEDEPRLNLTRYSYEVGGKLYQGEDSFSSGRMRLSLEGGEHCFVHPTQPAVSIFRRGEPFRHQRWLIGFSGALLLSLALLVYGTRRGRKHGWRT